MKIVFHERSHSLSEISFRYFDIYIVDIDLKNTGKAGETVNTVYNTFKNRESVHQGTCDAKATHASIFMHARASANNIESSMG
jgi:hypothetical protein